MALPVALQLYSVRDELEADFEGTIKLVKEIGYDGVEFAGLYDRSAEEVKKILDEVGLVPVSAHVPLDDLVENAEGLVAEYKAIGCEYIAVPYLTEERRPGTDGFERTIEDIKKIADVCKSQGIKLLYHNHDFEFEKIGDEYALDILYSEVSADRLETEIDTCWVGVAGENPSEYILKYSGRAPIVHLKDYYTKDEGKPEKLYDLIGIDDGEEEEEEESIFRPVGHGVQDMPSILDASVKAGAKWVVVEQDKPEIGETAVNSVKLSREYLKKLGW
ncbi:MAG: sugar phosphate isomerase/epimerase [Clostridia bacterium]|nr:sugar phosphate isomerase/epimerase [Clostridia bacterium]